MKKLIPLLTRYIPVAVIACLMILTYWSGLGDYLSFERLKLHREALSSFVQSHPWKAPFVFIGIYTLSTALSVPGAAVLSIFGGFLFPQPFATIYVVIAATLGASVIFLAARTALGAGLRKKAGGLLEKMRDGFQENAASYLLFLRLVPLFPFWLVNLAPAFFGVGLLTFVWTTFVGIIPGAFVFTQAGAGLGAILDSGDSLSLQGILNDDVKIALLALGIFALIPVILKRFRSTSRS